MASTAVPAAVGDLGFVEVRTRDVAKIVDHYTNVLSFEVSDRDDGKTYLTLGPDPHCVVVGEGEPTGRASVGLRLAGSIDEAESALRAAGVEATRSSDPQ